MSRRFIKNTALAVRAILANRFPACFAHKGCPKVPIKVDIFQDIIARCPDLKPYQIKFALQDYCRGPSYLIEMTCGAARIDLNGKESGTVSADDAAFSAGLLAGMKWCRSEAAE